MMVLNTGYIKDIRIFIHNPFTSFQAAIMGGEDAANMKEIASSDLSEEQKLAQEALIEEQEKKQEDLVIEHVKQQRELNESIKEQQRNAEESIREQLEEQKRKVWIKTTKSLNLIENYQLIPVYNQTANCFARKSLPILFVNYQQLYLLNMLLANFLIKIFPRCLRCFKRELVQKLSLGC